MKLHCQYKSLKARVTNARHEVPEELTSLSLGEEILIIPNQPMVEEKGLFENKLWLWILMILAIVIMGGFTLKMLRSQD